MGRRGRQAEVGEPQRAGMTLLPLSRRPTPWTADGWLSSAQTLRSPNFEARSSALAVDLLVIHYISLPAGRFSGSAVADLFLNRLDCASHADFIALQGLRVSAHFFIRRTGALTQFVAGDQRAWHAGQSMYQGRSACNDFSMGIELEGDGKHAFTQKQYARLATLTGQLLQRYPLQDVQGHSDIAPGRKLDPGPCFDWLLYGESLIRLSRRFSRNLFLSQALLRIGQAAQRHA